jgi:nucleoside-diphosphate-sugar epimerase
MNTRQWDSERILLTGGAGFLGRFIEAELRTRGANEIHVPRSSVHDLRNPDVVNGLVAQLSPSMIIHAAATVGGIGANRTQPGAYFYDNLIMGANIIEAARLSRIEKIGVIGTVCSYPKHTPLPFREESLWDGYPEETNAPYGIAKKALLVQGQAYRDQYGLNAIHLIPVNLYGPGDNYTPASSHVIPAIIDKCLAAKEQGREEVMLWGTGKATRAFLFIKDAARGIVDAMDRYDGREPLNLGSEEEISIRDLSSKIAETVGYRGRFIWDDSMPDGQPRRSVSSERARSLLGWSPSTDLDAGLVETIADRMKARRA